MHRPPITPVAFVATAAAVIASAAALAQQPAAKVAFPTLACAPPFVKHSSHDEVVKAFGATNVSYEDVPGAEGSTEKATVVFGKDPKRRLEAHWHDGETRSGLLLVHIKDQSQWAGPHGVKIGITLEEIEKINGRPFQLTGFGWDYGGFANFKTGKLARSPASECHVNIRFATTVNLPERRMRTISGDKQISSSNPDVRAARPKAVEVSIGYAFE